MADETKRPENPSAEEEKTVESSAGKSRFALLCGKTVQYWLAFLLISTLIVHGIGWAYYKSINTRAQADSSPEIEVGNFHFTADKTSGGRITGAEFSLFITALDGLDRIARTKMYSHKYRVQQEIESLLRQAHGGDFDDPALNDLKRQVREQINQVLGNRVISDVIVANLKITLSNNKESAAVADSASSPPWLEKSSSYVSQQGGN